jgi:hypothetical protein
MLLVGCLGDVLDSIRHLFLFNPALDMLLLTGVAFATVTVPSRHGVLPVMPAQPGPAIKPAGRGTATAGKAFL